MAEAAPAVKKVLKNALASTLQKIMSKAELSEVEKGKQSLDAIQKCFDDANVAGKRLFSYPDPEKLNLALKNLCHSVAVEELHKCYFEQCDFQTTMQGPGDRGILFVVYGRKGMGKTYACLSILAMKDSRAPRWILLFGGHYFSYGRRLLQFFAR
jgi:hypothetical protein